MIHGVQTVIMYAGVCALAALALIPALAAMGGKAHAGMGPFRACGCVHRLRRAQGPRDGERSVHCGRRKLSYQ